MTKASNNYEFLSDFVLFGGRAFKVESVKVRYYRAAEVVTGRRLPIKLTKMKFFAFFSKNAIDEKLFMGIL